eukprot:5003523-Ditylum_brightwellii.AAC.1
MSEEATTIKIPVFDGKHENFQSWWIWFQAYARVKQFSTVLKRSNDLPDNEEEISNLSASTDATEKKKAAAGKRNVLAMAHITMALGTEA